MSPVAFWRKRDNRARGRTTFQRRGDGRPRAMSFPCPIGQRFNSATIVPGVGLRFNVSGPWASGARCRCPAGRTRSKQMSLLRPRLPEQRVLDEIGARQRGVKVIAHLPALPGSASTTVAGSFSPAVPHPEALPTPPARSPGPPSPGRIPQRDAAGPPLAAGPEASGRA